MPLNDDDLNLIRLLVETSSLTGEELEQAWGLHQEVEQYIFWKHQGFFMKIRQAFLDMPRSHTMASRTVTNQSNYACAIEGKRESGYPSSWWALVGVCAVIAVVAVWVAR